jgi:SOS response regulatory protein OraA/RecX
MSQWSIKKNEQASKYRLICHVCYEDQPIIDLTWSVARFLKLPQDSNADSLYETLQPYIQKAGYSYAITRLALKAYSIHQLQKLLKTQLVETDCINWITSKLVEEGYCKDEELANSIQQRLLRKGKSNQYIKMYLNQKGLGVWKQESNEEAQVEAIGQWLERWARRDDLLLKPSKYWQRLAQRGFSSESIQKAWQLWMQRVKN